MAAYPTLPYCRGSERAIRSGVEIDLATDGTVRGRRFYAEDLYEFHLVHHAITGTQKDSLLSFWSSNRTALIEYTWDEDSAVYEVYFAAPPRIVFLRGDHYTAEVDLIGQAQ